tara:strand:- start:509 stop:652 length:144 start_codon:yes stop_codon:yes gene_type:complete
MLVHYLQLQQSMPPKRILQNVFIAAFGFHFISHVSLKYFLYKALADH